MTATPRLSVRGGPRAQASLNAFAFDEAKFVEAGTLIMGYLRQTQREAFKNQTSPTGQSWPEYEQAEPKYGAYKKRLLGSDLYPSMLRWPGGNERLFPSLTRENHSEHVAVIDAGARLIRFGTRVPYAINHQLGRGKGPFGEPIATRPFLSLGVNQAADIRRIIARVTGI